MSVDEKSTWKEQGCSKKNNHVQHCLDDHKEACRKHEYYNLCERTNQSDAICCVCECDIRINIKICCCNDEEEEE